MTKLKDNSIVHMTAKAKNSELSKVMMDFKKFTSGSLIMLIGFGRESSE